MRKAQKICLGIGIAGALASIGCGFASPHHFYEAWLIGWFYWLSIALGCLSFFMIYRLTGGAWGEGIERILISAGRTIELLLLLFLPLLGSFHALYPWAHSELAAADERLAHNHPYLNIGWWIGRAAIYFALWILLSWWPMRLGKEGTRRVSALGLIVIVISVSFASVDWIMSLEPLWYSTVYGLIIVTGQGIAAYSFALVCLHFLARRHPAWNPPLTEKVLKDHGSLLLTASILWTYVSFVQWLIIWIGNIPETVTWYVTRATDVWAGLAWLVFIGQFLIPFQLLLWQSFKQRTANLAGLGVFILVVHFLELYWLIVPGTDATTPGFNWMTIPACLAVGGLWLALFLRNLGALELASPGSEYTPRLGELARA